MVCTVQCNKESSARIDIIEVVLRCCFFLSLSRSLVDARGAATAGESICAANG